MNAATVRIWLTLAVLVTVICLFVNVAVQQNFRMSANDPQIQIAQDAAQTLVQGRPIPENHASPVDIGRSLAPWLTVYDASGRTLMTTGLLDGQPPEPPGGVFATARSKGEDRITWQPARGIRIATIVEFVPKPQPRFVVSGRSLREIELRVENLNGITLAAWAALLLISFVLAVQITSRVRPE